MRHLLALLFLFTATLSLRAGADAWLEDGLLKPEIIQQIKPKLGLTADQESRMTAIITETRKKAEPVENTLKEQQQALHDMLRHSETTADAASSQLSKVLESEAALKQIQLRMLIALRDVLTPEQQIKAQTLGAPKAAARIDTESQVMAKAARLRAAIQKLGSQTTAAMQARSAEIVQLLKSGDLQAADAALDKLVADSEVDKPEAASAAPDFSKYDTGGIDLETLKQRYQAVQEAAQSVVSIPLFRQLLKAREALEAAKAAEDLATIGRILTWAEKTLEQGKAMPPGSKAPAGASLTPKPAAAEPVQPAPSGPRLIKAGDVAVGRMVPDLAFTDIKGVSHRLSEINGEAGLVIAMTSATCPVSKRYLPTLAALEKELRGQHIALLLVNPFESETAADIQSQLAAAGLTAMYAHDKGQALATALGARATTEVFLLDAKRTLIYRGALDDQYGLTYSLDAPRATYLRDAVAAMRAHQRPRIAATEPPGCELGLPEARNHTATEVTYHRDVERILQENCVACHRDHGIAPFALDDLAEVKDRAKTIKRVISEGAMPPWFAAPLKGGNPWANDRSLSARDKADLLAWLGSSNHPLGDAHEAPAKLVFPSEWSIGQPDLIVQLPQPVAVKADGFMPYQVVTAQTTLTEDKWVQAYEILPTDRSVVHHVIVTVRANGSAATHGREEGGGYWAVYVPGNGAHTYPQGFARKLPAGATVTFQIHYTPSGQAVREQLRMGLVFARETPRFAVETIDLSKHDLEIPPGDANHEESMERTVPFDVNVMAYMAHMHVRGKAFKFELIGADGAAETLLDIPRYDFNWQLRYDYAQPRTIPRGSKVRVTAVFDNSAGNKANPDPSKRVKWGQQTYEEMMIGFIEYFVPIPQGVAAK